MQISKNVFRVPLVHDLISEAGRGKQWPRGLTQAWSYAVALLSVAAVMLLRFELQSLLGDYARYLPFVLAVMFSAWYGGLGPGLLATGLSAFTASFFRLSPADHPLSITELRGVVQLAMFGGIGVMISALSGA